MGIWIAVVAIVIEGIARVAGGSHGWADGEGKERPARALSYVSRTRCGHRRQNAVNAPESFAIASLSGLKSADKKRQASGWDRVPA